MKTILAFIITIIISQFCLTAGLYVGLLPSLLLFWLPIKMRAPIVTFVAGVAGSISSILVAFFVFKWLVGPDSFGWIPFLAATIPLSIPIYNDYRKSVELKRIQGELPERVASFTAPDTLGSRTVVFGELAGIILGGVLFL